MARLQKMLLPSWQVLPAGPVDTLISIWAAPQVKLPSTRNYHLLYWDETRMVRSIETSKVDDCLEDLLGVCFATYSTNRFFLHAGAVEVDGQAILLPGQSLSGKSTLVRALQAAGANVYSDEFAVLDSKGRLHAYPRPLSLRVGAGKPRERIPIQARRKPIPIRSVVFAQYTEGAEFSAVAIDPGATTLELTRHSLPIRFKPKQVLRVLANIAQKVSCYRVTRGEADLTVARTIMSLG